MKIAIVGSREITAVNISRYISECDEIVSGGAKGVDTCARKYAEENGILITEFLPDYKRYGRGAPLIRNKEIVGYSDKVLVFWNGTSKGTLSVIKYAEKIGKECRVIIVN